MVQEMEKDTRDIFDAVEEEVAESPEDDDMMPERQDSSSSGNRYHSNTIFWLLGLIILVLLIALLLKGGGKDVPSISEFKTLKEKTAQVEQKLAGQEATVKKIDSMERQVQNVQQAFTRLDGADRSFKEKMDRLAQQVEKLSEELSAPPVKPSPQSSAHKASAPQAKGRYHEVLPKETLFQIARKYNLTVEQLRLLNNLSKDQMIQPGQKLLVTPGNSR